MTEKRDKVYLELIRIFAIFFVIFNHTGSSGSVLYTHYVATDVKYWLWLFISNFCRVNVPLFFMVSGALLLGKNETIEDIFTKRVSRIALVLVVISVLHYLCINVNLWGTHASLKSFLKLFYTGKLSVVYWFLYAYISFLVTLPFLRSIAQRLDGRTFLYLAFVIIGYMTIRPLFEFLVLNNKLHITGDINARWLAQTAVIFPLTGYYLENVLDISKINKKHIMSMIAIVIICGIINCYISYLSEAPSGKHRGVYRDTFFFINSVISFICLKWIYLNSTVLKKYSRQLLALGSTTFGIYVFHVIVMGYVNHYGIWTPLHKVFHKGFGILVYVLIVGTISMIITKLVKRIPYCKKMF